MNKCGLDKVDAQDGEYGVGCYRTPIRHPSWTREKKKRTTVVSNSDYDIILCVIVFQNMFRRE